MSDVVTVSPQETRVEPVKASSPSWFIARINAVSRIIGALLLCIPMFISLDAVSASTALGIEFVLLWIGGVAPWTVCRKTWPVWIAAAGSFISVFLYGRTSGEILWQGGWIVISEGSINLAIATAIRVAAIAVPGVILALGLDPTDLADGLVEILHFSPRFVYGGLAGLRMFTLLQEDWRALGLSQRSRGLGDGNAIASVRTAGALHPACHQTCHRHGSARLRLRRPTFPSPHLASEAYRLDLLRHLSGRPAGLHRRSRRHRELALRLSGCLKGDRLAQCLSGCLKGDRLAQCLSRCLNAL